MPARLTTGFQALALIAVGLIGAQEPEKSGARELEIRALANEGFLLRAGDDVVVIDAFVAEPYSSYGALSGEALAALEGGSGPFASLDLALTSHYHRDHFQAEPARRLRAACPEVLFATSPQVLESLKGTEAAPDVTLTSVRAVLPEPDKSESLTLGGIRVEFLRLSHGTGRFADIQNLGHLITLGGQTLLHVGDAEMVPANFAVYGLAERGIDVVFVPFWYFGSEEGRAIIAEHFRGAQLIACHIPPNELEQIAKKLAAEHPDVLVPKQALELLRIRE